MVIEVRCPIVDCAIARSDARLLVPLVRSMAKTPPSTAAAAVPPPRSQFSIIILHGVSLRRDLLLNGAVVFFLLFLLCWYAPSNFKCIRQVRRQVKWCGGMLMWLPITHSGIKLLENAGSISGTWRLDLNWSPGNERNGGEFLIHKVFDRPFPVFLSLVQWHFYKISSLKRT